MSRLRPRHHLGDTLLVPIRGPEVTVVDGERETAGPASQTGKLPAADEGVQQGPGVAREIAALAKGQLGDPVGVELMGGIEIRHTATAVRIKCVDQPSPRCANIYARTEAKPRRGGGDVDRS